MARPKRVVVEGVRVQGNLLELLQETLTDKGVEQWLKARLRLLDGCTPVAYLKQGKRREVMQAAAAFVEGAYL